MTATADFRRAFAAAGIAAKDVKAPPGLELADVAWPLVSAHMIDVASGLRRASDDGVVEASRVQSILNRLVYNLYTLVFGATSRVMVVEMAAAESTGLMQGDTPEERYEFFAEMLLDPSFCAQILDQYPVLKDQLVAICRNWKAATLELISRLVADWELILQTFFRGQHAGKAVDLEISVGDVHRRGRSTCIVHFANLSRVVYKPRPLAVDVHFRAFAEWVNQKLEKPQILVPETIDQGDYGWSAFIPHEPACDEAELTAYYERLGAVLALAFLSGLSDLHAENVIAHRAWPVLVDLEALFRPVIKNDAANGAARESNRLLDQSVLATQLLAARASNSEDERIVDLGGIVDLAGQETLFKVPTWRNMGRVDARLDYALHPYGSSFNLPVFRGTRVSADFYGEEIIGGFVEVYRLLHDHKSVLRTESSPLAAFREDITRVVLRPTSHYARLVSASFHPDYLQDPRDKDEFYAGYLKDEESDLPGHQDFVAAEIDDLWQCDIPYFTVRAGSRELVSSQGSKLGMRAIATGLDLACRRLDGLGETDLDRQCWLIRLMLARSDNRSGSKALPLLAATSRFDLLEDARSIAHTAAETICANAIYSDDRTRATWHAVGEAAGVATVNDADLDLYSGLPGIALFLCLAGRLLDTPGYGDVARCALNEILDRVDAPDASPLDVGGYVGSGGLAYALQQLAADFPDHDLERRATEVFLATDHERAGDIDLAYGLAGALLSCITLYRHRPIISTEDRAVADRLLGRASMIGRSIADRLENDGHSGKLPEGFAHGTAGVAAALARLFSETGDRQVGALARKLLNETASVADAEELDCSWCRGQTGLILALGEGAALLEDKGALERAVKHIAARTGATDHSLCHGAMGIVTTLQKTSTLAGQVETANCPPIAPLVREMSGSGLLCGTINAVVSPGLMDGLAGIGLGALSVIKPDAVPFVLTLDSASGKRNRI